MPSVAVPFVITFASLLIVSITAASPHCISCPCGSSSQNYTHCIDESLLKDLSCERWSRCETCKANTTFCITCPPDRSGPTCSEITQGHTRRKRQDDAEDLLNHPNYPRQSGSCPFLERPESGSIRCSQTGNARYCTSRCLPGYHFEGHDNEDEITLRCLRGVWKPQSFFPRCISGGHCEVDVTGSGFYNCTIDMDGTHCDITCDGWYRGRFNCYPGRPWDPPLPSCTIPKEPTPCRCENGGICDERGKCMCPERRTGTYCENLEREKATCEDPGIPRDASRLNPDGSDASYSRVFEEGESVIFTCNNERAALQGKSYITCLPDRTWSAPLPRCITSRSPGPIVYCPDPGYIQFGSRVNADSSNSRPSSRYRSGESVVYYCHEGYGLVGHSKLTCLPSGQWSSNKPVCRRFAPVNTPTERPTSQGVCSHPGVEVNGRIEGESLLDPRKRYFPVGEELQFSCNAGFEPEGPTIITCRSNGQWTSLPPKCRSIAPDTGRCPLPVVNPNVEVDEFFDLDQRKSQLFEPGDKLTFSCREGNDLEGPREIECFGNGRWSSSPPTCNPKPPDSNRPVVGRPKLCPPPHVDPNGEVEEWFLDPRKLRQSFEPGAELTFRCKEGYVLQGWATIRCNTNGQWSNSSPKCNVRENPNSEVRCKNPGHIDNGRLDVYPPYDETTQPSAGDDDFDFPLGTHLKYTCEEGYSLVGTENSLTCEINGYWSGSTPICVKNR